MNSKGFVLVLGLLMLMIMTTIGVMAIHTMTFNTIIERDNYESGRAFWIAEAGGQTAKVALNIADSVQAFSDTIVLSNPTQFGDGDYSITPKIIDNEKVTVIVRSVGHFAHGTKFVEYTLQKISLDTPGALYSEACVKIHGQCEINGGTKPGIVTPLADITNGIPAVDINGVAAHVIGQGLEPSIRYNQPDMSIAQMIEFFKQYATIPSGDVWGTEANPIVVSFKGDNLKLGGESGYGIILMEGNLNVHGGFDWNGLIIVTGKISFSGGASDKVNITGGILSGETAEIGTDTSDFGGSMVLHYADMTSLLKKTVGTVKTLAWREVTK